VEAEVATLREMHRAAEALPYYDEAADRAARERYYAGIDLSAADAEALRAALSRRLRETHRPRNYKPMELVYPRVDKRRDGTLRSIYSGQPFTAEEIVRADLEVERQRSLAREALPAAFGGAAFEAALDLLEASLPYNCEHVVPQSWFGKREPERGDLHHLFTCESRCNSFRGNTPYWDFPDFEEVVRSQCGKLEGGDRFEPSAGKGAVARATLYFLLRYPGRIDGRYGAERMAMLLAWHAAKPVDEWERHRNAVIEELQGNRNPFIDAPELAGRLFR
jgi:endonuclease I